MVDRNLRRILYHLKRERIGTTEVKEHFALLPPPSDDGEQEFEDAVLESFGVTAIRLDNPNDLGRQVKAIMKRLYLSVDGVTEEDWMEAGKRKAQTTRARALQGDVLSDSAGELGEDQQP